MQGVKLLLGAFLRHLRMPAPPLPIQLPADSTQEGQRVAQVLEPRPSAWKTQMEFPAQPGPALGVGERSIWGEELWKVSISQKKVEVLGKQNSEISLFGAKCFGIHM